MYEKIGKLSIQIWHNYSFSKKHFWVIQYINKLSITLDYHDLSLKKPNDAEYCDQDEDCVNPLHCELMKKDKIDKAFSKEYQKRNFSYTSAKGT